MASVLAMCLSQTPLTLVLRGMRTRLLVIPRGVAAVNAFAAAVALAASADPSFSEGLQVRSLIASLVLLAVWAGAAVQGRAWADLMYRQPVVLAVVCLVGAVVCQIGFGGWRSPLFLPGVFLTGTGATVLSSGRAAVYGALAALGYLGSLAVTASLSDLSDAGDLFRVPYNACAFVLVAVLGSMLGGVARRLRGLEHDLSSGQERWSMLHSAVNRVREADDQMLELLESPALAGREGVEAAAREIALAGQRGAHEQLGLAAGDLGGVIGGQLEWERKLADRQIDVRLSVEDGVPPDVAPEIVEEMVGLARNVFKNALQHRPRPGAIEVDIARADGWVSVAFHNIGAQPSAAVRLDGSGGLSNARRRLEALGGTLDVEQRPGRLSLIAGAPVR